MNYYDYHMHSDNSHDGVNSIEEMCKRAILLGMEEIAITDHFDPTYSNNYYYCPETYFVEYNKAKKEYGEKINLRSGVEIGQPHLHRKKTNELLKRFNYDYILASLHEFTMGKNVVDLMEVNYTKDNWLQYFNGYFDHMEEMIKWNRYDCIGHIDLPKRYISAAGIEIDESKYLDRIKNILKEIINKGKGIEINTSGLRQAPKDCFPSFNIIKLYRQLGGEIITVGSDAHNIDDLGKGGSIGVELLTDAGFKYITYFEEGRPKFNPLRRIA